MDKINNIIKARDYLEIQKKYKELLKRIMFQLKTNRMYKRDRDNIE